MSCEICGRNSCTRSFHTLEEQEQFDTAADAVKDRMRNVLKAKIERLTDRGQDGDRYLIDLDEVLAIIDDY